jgi:hypothetical protein
MIEKPLSRVRPGRPPADLREEVLRAAAAPAVRRRERGWTGFDLGLAATLALLLLGHAVLSLHHPQPSQPTLVAERSQQAPPTELRSALDLEQLGARLEKARGASAGQTLTVATVLRTTS